MTGANKHLLILDVDETLLFAAEQPLDRQRDCAVGPYSIYCRPGLQAFLLQCQRHFDLAVWSSSGDDYLRGVIAATFPSEISLEFVWSRERCVQRFDPEWHSYYFVKDLKKVKRRGYDLGRVLIVEDTPQKVERNYGNAVYVTPYFGSDEDSELDRLGMYLESLRSIPNVRNVEKRNWKRRF